MKNKLQISIDNFQSIKHADLEFEQGINVLVGQSNSGKSATLRALKTLILNPKGCNKFIKSGESGFSVTINYLGNDITLIRNKKDLKYIVNGEEYQKVGNSNLSKILDKSGFVLDSSGNLMNIESELELPFPFDKNPQDLFKLFEKSIFCVSDSALVLKTIKADEDTLHKDKEEAKNELKRFTRKISALDELSEEVDLDKLKEGKIKLEELFFEYDKFTENFNKVVESVKAVKALKEFKDEIKQPDLTSYFKLVNDIEKLEELAKVKFILEVAKPEIKVTINVDEYMKLKADLAKVVKIIKTIKDNKEEREEVKGSANLEEFIKLNKDFKEVARIIKRCKELKASIDENTIKKDSLKQELSTFKVCPLCGQEIKNGEHDE